MLAIDLPFLPPRASEQAAQVDYLFYFISFVTGAATLLVFFLLIFCAPCIAAKALPIARRAFSVRTSWKSSGAWCRW